MTDNLLRQLLRRQWTNSAGRVIGIVVESPWEPPESGTYDGYHSSIQRFLKQCRSLELRTVDDSAPYSWLAVYPPPLDEQGRPATNVKTYGAPPKFKKWGTDWLHLDAFDANCGLVLSIEHGAVLWAEDSGESTWTLTFVADSLESWFRHWLGVDSVEDCYPSPERTVEGVSATEFARRCDGLGRGLRVSGVPEMLVFSMEDARPGDVMRPLGPDAIKLDGRLAWVV
ncbi:MAG: hypothetical protein ACQEVA_01265 [Myxococcota bacterium]